jgi:hypothetical protein
MSPLIVSLLDLDLQYSVVTITSVGLHNQKLDYNFIIILFITKGVSSYIKSDNLLTHEVNSYF